MVDRKKEDFMSQIEHYRAVLADLQGQRDLHQLKITEIDKAMSSLQRLIPNDAKDEIPSANYNNAPSTINVRPGKYSGMSVRWAILNLLNEDATGPMSTGAIADALQQGGITSAGKNFNANVSAVLSGMYHERHEVTSSDDGWIISQTGRQSWAAISASRSRQTSMISSNVQ